MQTNSTTLRLIYLWAFVESGLGGIMHLFHIPITGFIIGGFSIIINILLAKYSHGNIKTLLTGLGIVLLVKFTLSPQSPFGAYLAVSFQGLVAILLFNFLSVNKFSIFFYSTIIMLENAIQKPLLGYLIYGNKLGKGIQELINKFFHQMDLTNQFLIGFVVLYFLIYMIWAMLISVWTYDIISKLSSYKLPVEFFNEKIINTESKSKKPKQYLYFIFVIILFLAILLSIYFLNNEHINYIIKTISLFFILGFIIPIILKKILTKYQIKYSTNLSTIIAEFPKLKLNCDLSYSYAKKINGIKRWKEFIFLCIYSNVFYTKNEH